MIDANISTCRVTLGSFAMTDVTSQEAQNVFETCHTRAINDHADDRL